MLTTFAARQEPHVLDLLGLPAGHAICAVIYLGYPEHQNTRLSRHPVEDFTFLDRFGQPY